MKQLEAKVDACWRLLRRSKPRSKRRTKLESEMVNIQLRRLRAEIRAGRAKSDAGELRKVDP